VILQTRKELYSSNIFPNPSMVKDSYYDYLKTIKPR